MPLIGWVSTKDAALLCDVIDLHVEGVAASRELTVEDPTVRSAEELLDLMSGYDDDMEALARIRKKLT